jgi:hypothetical protein
VSQKQQNNLAICKDGAGSGRSHKRELLLVAMNVLRLHACQHKIQVLSPNDRFPKQGKKKKNKIK